MKGSLRIMILLRSARSSAIVRTAALLALTLLLSFRAFASDGDLADKLRSITHSPKSGFP
jgi:hypothetical protein